MGDVYVYYSGSIELVNKRPTVRTKQTTLGTGYLLLQRVERRKKIRFYSNCTTKQTTHQHKLTINDMLGGFEHHIKGKQIYNNVATS